MIRKEDKQYTFKQIKNIQNETLTKLNNSEDVRKAKWLFSVFNNLISKNTTQSKNTYPCVNDFQLMSNNGKIEGKTYNAKNKYKILERK